MFLLPGAERYRRVLLTGAVVGLLCVQAVFQISLVEIWTLRICGPLQLPVAALAGSLDESLFGVPNPTAPAESNSLTPSALLLAERRMGLPAPVSGMAWLEVPVQSLELERGRMVLAAGQDFHLARGQVVAFGKLFLGRLGEIRPHEADVDLWLAADVRTGLSLVQENQASQRAVSLGRGRAGQAVVNWAEDKTQFASGILLGWRPRPLDSPAFAAAGLMMGTLAREGDEARGDALWVVQQKIPAAAQGRVYVAAGAVGTQLIAEPSQRHMPATRLLAADAILGRNFYAFAAADAFTPRVISAGGKVCGEVQGWRGFWGWAKRLAPGDWETRAVALDSTGTEVLAAPDWMKTSGSFPLFTRGGQGIPRGLWLGYSREGACAPSYALEALRLDSKAVMQSP